MLVLFRLVRYHMVFLGLVDPQKNILKQKTHNFLLLKPPFVIKLCIARYLLIFAVIVL